MQRLKTMLNSIDHKGYPAYKGLKGSYDFGEYRLGIDKVQGDPFASPSRISLVMPQSTHAIPKSLRAKASQDRSGRSFTPPGLQGKRTI